MRYGSENASSLQLPVVILAVFVLALTDQIDGYFKLSSYLALCDSGVVEGLNNKAKVTMRKSYGFSTYRVLELALYHSVGKLPEPDSTHDFF